jgi:protein TonB
MSRHRRRGKISGAAHDSTPAPAPSLENTPDRAGIAGLELIPPLPSLIWIGALRTPRLEAGDIAGTTDSGTWRWIMFEHSLIDLEVKPQQPRRRWLSLPIAVGLHVVGLSAFAFASYWSVGTVPEPQLNAAFFVSLPTPPPPASGGGGPRTPVRQEQRQTTRPAATNQVVQPSEKDIPDKPPAASTAPTLDEVVPGPGTGDPTSGGPGGPCVVCPPGDGPVGPGPGGPGGPGEEPGVGPVDAAPLHFSVGMTRPEVLYSVQPRYSELARRAGVQGSVSVEAVIDQQGRVTDVRVLRGLPMNLDRAAVEAIRQWRFKPAMMGDHPVKVYYILTVNFTIQR